MTVVEQEEQNTKIAEQELAAADNANQHQQLVAQTPTDKTNLLKKEQSQTLQEQKQITVTIIT